MIYNLHLFDGSGNCIFSLNKEEREEDTKLLYGFLYSLKSFTQRITPVLLRDNHFFTYSTNCYQLLFLEMATSLKIVLLVNPDLSKSNDYFKQMLRELYRTVYVEFVVKNPIKRKPGEVIDSLLFRERVIEFLAKI